MSSCGCCPPVIFAAAETGSPGDCVCNPTIDPQACNTLQDTGDGLLVPRTELVAVVGDPPDPVGDDRSVDVDVAPAPGCPDQWQIGARLTPASGFLNAQAGSVDLVAQGSGNTADVPASDIDLPEVGTYHIDSDVRYELSTQNGASAIIVGHLQDITAGVPLTSFTKIAGINSGVDAGVTPGPETQQGTTHIMTEYTIPAAPRTIRLHLTLFVFGGTVSGATAGGSDSNGATRMRFLKVRD